MKTLMLAVVIVGLVAVAKDPNGIKGDNKSKAQGSESNRQHDTAATSTVIATTTPQPVPNRETSGVDPKATHHDTHPPNNGPAQKPWFDSQFWFNLLLVIFTGLLALLAHRSLKAMHRQADLMSDQLAEMKTTSADTNKLAAAAQEQAMASKETAMAASHTADTAMKQTEAMLVQAQALILSADAAKESAAITRRQLEAYERPWVTASFEARSRLDFNDSGLWVTFGVTLKNIEHSIATHISYGVEIVPLQSIGNDYGPVIARQDAIAKRIQPEDAGYVLLSGDEIPIFAPCRLDNESIKRHAVTIDGAEYLILCLAVVITYRYPTSDRSHTTRLGFMFGNITEPVEGFLFVKIGQALPQEKITILRLTSGNYAD